MSNLPKDPIMLLSYINTELRDNYANVEELCSALSLEKNDLDQKLGTVGYEYDREHNQYV